MKKVLFVVALCVAIVAANAQETQKAVKANIETVKAKPGQQVANKTSQVVVKEADLMKPIKEDYVKQVPGATFENAYKIEKKGSDVYNVVVNKDKVSWILMYDKDGKFIKKEEMKMPEKIKTVKSDIKQSIEQPQK